MKITGVAVASFCLVGHTSAFSIPRTLQSAHQWPNQRRTVSTAETAASTATRRTTSSTVRWATSNDNSNNGNDDNKGKKKTTRKRKAKAKTPSEKQKANEKNKEALMESVKAKMKEQRGDVDQPPSKPTLLSNLNPFQAGKSLRNTFNSLTSNLGGLSQQTRQKYYLDDRLSSDFSLNERNPTLERLERDDYVPEVLVVGATGEVGRRVVRRLLLEGRCRVRVLVRDLYSETLNLLGTGVTYCQGDLSNTESLEYALTDVDKIVFCAAAPKPDESDFKQNFQSFVQENLLYNQNHQAKAAGTSTTNVTTDVTNSHKSSAGNNKDGLFANGRTRDNKEALVGTNIVDDDSISDMEWEQLDSVLEIRSKLAEQVDLVGMGNLVRAYQNVRHADYGTSQAAKRSLFKFSSRPEDFALFSIDDGSTSDIGDLVDDEQEQPQTKSSSSSKVSKSKYSSDSSSEYDDDDDKYGSNDYDEDEYKDYYEEYEYEDDEDDVDDGYGENDLEQRRDATSQTQCRWLRNEFGSGVFVGKVPKSATQGGMEGEAAIISSRLRARDDPDNGIDLGAIFAGFVIRAIADGSNFEAFIRTSAYDEQGIEYVCQFSTQSKALRSGSSSRNKAVSVRLPFDSFVPIIKSKAAATAAASDDNFSAKTFDGSDVRYIGFRYRSINNELPRKVKDRGFVNFYMALRHVKVYRTQPEPEFVYLSDARIPEEVKKGMVRHDLRRLFTAKDVDNKSGEQSVEILSDQILSDAGNKMERSKAETYYKYRGEEILKNSGLSYTIVRVAGFNELMSGEASTINLDKAAQSVAPVSRDEAAQVCVGALMDPNALNKSVYMGKSSKRGAVGDENIGAKFAALPID